MNQKPEPQQIGPTGLDSLETGQDATLWQTYSFAPHWYNDAKAEAQLPDHNARRREIVFAVTCAESYLVEWVRDCVLSQEISAMKLYFPGGEQRGVRQKYKDVIKALCRDGRIPSRLHLGGQQWQQFRDLVTYRDGLVHASSSRPETSGLPDKERPVPSKSDLDKYPAGQAVQIVRALLKKLHADTGTPEPEWL
jgi:hypothetical protein